MIVLFGVVALLFATIGGLLVAQGLLVFFVGFSGGGVVGLVEAGLGVLPLYASYLFARAAIRSRRASNETPLTSAETRERRDRTRTLVWYTVANITAAIFLPVPGVLKGAMIATNLVVLPLVLAREVEPPKRKRQS